MTVIRSFKYFADNEWFSLSNGNFFDRENPATGEAWVRIRDCGDRVFNNAVSKSKKF